MRPTSSMKRALTQHDLPPTQPPSPRAEEGEGYEDDNDYGHEMGPDDEEHDDGGMGDMPEQPDVAWYLSHWDMSNLAKIAICRTYANYLSAQIPKGEGPRVTHKRKIKK